MLLLFCSESLSKQRWHFVLASHAPCFLIITAIADRIKCSQDSIRRGGPGLVHSASKEPECLLEWKAVSSAAARRVMQQGRARSRVPPNPPNPPSSPFLFTREHMALFIFLVSAQASWLAFVSDIQGAGVSGGARLRSRCSGCFIRAAGVT